MNMKLINMPFLLPDMKEGWIYGYTELGSYGYTVYGLLFTVYSLRSLRV